MSSLKRKAADSATNSAKKPTSIVNFFKPAAPTSSSASAKATKFDKAKWVAGLSKDEKDLLGLEIETLHESWLSVLKDELVSPSFLKLKRFLVAEKGVVYPPAQDVYSW
jgi:uracil-DNA glycosylase